MGKHWQNYKHSFKRRKEMGWTLLLDVFSYGLIGLLWLIFGLITNDKAYAMSQGKTTEELKQLLLSNPEQAQAFLTNIQGFVITFVVGLVIVIIGSIMIYSFSRKLIWDYLTKKKTKFWKWNWLTLMLIILLIIYLLLFGLIKTAILYLIILFNNQTLLSWFNMLLSIVGIFTFILFIFLAYYSFSRKYKVWESLGDTFQLLKEKWPRLWRMLVFVLLTIIITTLILWLVNKYLISVGLWINLVVFLILVVWMRIYTLQTIK